MAAPNVLSWLVALVALGACQTQTTDLVPGALSSAEPKACGQQNAICLTDQDCCAGGPAPLRCMDDAPGLHTRHCATDPAMACHADGEPCAHPKDCCGAYCVPAAAGMLTCSSLCRALGEACAAPGDCCGPGLGCASGDGGQQCAVMP